MAALGAPGTGWASPASAPDVDAQLADDYGVRKLEELSLLELLDIPVTTVSKSRKTLRNTPGVVTVITREEIQSHGYRSLADCLRRVPGFYDVYDLVFHNIGVRGVNGGGEAAGSIIKVMIDGQAVHFRPSTGNFFGEELVPLDAVERIEVVRGPASALYGANAFLGVVNVITRSGEDAAALTVAGRVGLVRDRPLHGVSAVAAGSAGEHGPRLLVAAQRGFVDRSGLFLPPGSPLHSLDVRWSLENASERDYARPVAVLAKGSLGDVHDRGEVAVWVSIQSLDAKGTFQDFGAMSNLTRVALENQNYRLSYALNPIESLRLRLSVKGFESSPSELERLDIQRPGQVLLRNVRTSGYGGELELHLGPWAGLALAVGADYLDEKHRLQTFDTLLTEDARGADGVTVRAAGTRIPGPEAGRKKTFTNWGVYAQGEYALSPSIEATVGMRLDVHSAYSLQVSPRAAVVWAPAEEAWHLKLLYGTSFKAPSAEQLYTQPVRGFPIRGNEKLEPQAAQTLELAGGYAFGSTARLLANAFFVHIDGRVEYVQRGLLRTAENLLDEEIVGAELDAQLHLLSETIIVQLGVGFAYTLSQRERADQVILGTVKILQPLYPSLQLHADGVYALPLWDLRASVELSYVGPRAASQSNALEAGSAYDLPAYVLLSAALSTPGYAWIPERLTRLIFRIHDALGREYYEPGSGGVDISSVGRVLLLTISQEL